MRQLGDKRQSVTFYIPFDIQRQIRASLGINADQDINVCDVVSWTIQQTWAETERLMLPWALQGCKFERQSKIWQQAQAQVDSNSNELRMDSKLADKFKESDVRTIEEQYKPRLEPTPMFNNVGGENINRIRERYQEFHASAEGTNELEEEQEREMVTEVEEEQEIERPKPLEPKKSELHKGIIDFIKTGHITVSASGIIGAFQSMSNTTAAAHFDVGQFPRHLQVTKDFSNAIKVARGCQKEKKDLYKREVEYILTAVDGNNIVKKMIVISPFEAESLLPEIENSEHVALHVYSARQNSNFCAIDNLELYVIPKTAPTRIVPPWLKIELNLFSGQLYFDTFKEYTEVCDYLGLAWTSDSEEVGTDGFISHRYGDRRTANGLNVTTSPVPFLKSLMTSVRYHGGSIEKTHVGKMLCGAILTENDFGPRMKRQREDDEGSLFVC